MHKVRNKIVENSFTNTLYLQHDRMVLQSYKVNFNTTGLNIIQKSALKPKMIQILSSKILNLNKNMSNIIS